MSFLLGPDSSRGSSGLFSIGNMKKRKTRKQGNHLIWFCEGKEQCGSPADVSPPRCYFWQLCDVFCFQRRPAWMSPAEWLRQTFSEESCWWHTCHKTHINQCCRITLEIKYEKSKGTGILYLNNSASCSNKDPPHDVRVEQVLFDAEESSEDLAEVGHLRNPLHELHLRFRQETDAHTNV